MPFTKKEAKDPAKNTRKSLLGQLNIYAHCKKSGLTLWQCPQFLFIVMGTIIIISSFALYLIGNQYIAEPELVAFVVIAVNMALLVIAFLITKNFEKLAEVSKLKSEFISITSHQLRSPLTNLKWIVDALSIKNTENTSQKKEEYFEGIQENLKRMSELINDLLIVSRIEEGTLSSQKQEINFKKLVKEIISQFKVFTEALNIKINFDIEEKASLIFADWFNLKLVIENLLDNAIRYTGKKGEIDISVKKLSNGIYFQIKDTGIGIPEPEQKYIFQKFFRAENPLKEKTRGSGLGLYIVKSIIEKEKGKIWFESAEGKGTTFYFFLPIK